MSSFFIKSKLNYESKITFLKMSIFEEELTTDSTSLKSVFVHVSSHVILRLKIYLYKYEAAIDQTTQKTVLLRVLPYFSS